MKNKEIYLWKCYRIKGEFIDILSYFSRHCVINNINKQLCFDTVINYSLDFIKKNKLTYNFEDYGKCRKPKHFYCSVATFNRLDKYITSQSIEYWKGEIVELLLYLYMLNNFTEEEKNIINFYNFNWGINVKNYKKM